MSLESRTLDHILLFRPCVILVLLLLFPSLALSKKDHLVYFPNTAYELNIYKIYGKRPGKTLMLVGGIQGNEPGGFLSADLYADMSLEKGNLIVVPRANFYSIILNQRGPNGDMNRKFTHEDAFVSMEDKIVNILKKLISESDYLLNLHDGSGFFYPKYINKWRNPTCFGQSIIADAEEFQVPGADDRVIKLGEMARKILDEVNPHINNELHKFHYMNTRTGDADSPHREQRMSATYYALTKHHIPAFGIETSKFLPTIDLKVQQHNLIINAFMKQFDIVPESPGLVLDPPVLKYLVLSVNGKTPIVLREQQTLALKAGDFINVTHIEANYERGLSLDILGHGGLNDYRKDFAIFKDTTLIVRKDNQEFAEIPLKVISERPEGGKKADKPLKIDHFVIEAKGYRLLLSEGKTLHLVSGDELKIVDVLPILPASSGITVNFKGFVGDKRNNTGEDRGYVIDTGSALLERYSLDGKGQSYEIVVTRGDDLLGRAVVKLDAPKMQYLILKVNDQQHFFLRPGDNVPLRGEDKICLEAIQTNLYSSGNILLSINGHKIREGEAKTLKDLFSASRSPYPVRVERGGLTLGEIWFSMKN
ncbi:MAG: M14/M99 family metallopeptidase [Desulfobacterales bacterium]|nr:M14/M99 family metallopeptidase [Desulfobacterales bacterium]